MVFSNTQQRTVNTVTNDVNLLIAQLTAWRQLPSANNGGRTQIELNSLAELKRQSAKLRGASRPRSSTREETVAYKRGSEDLQWHPQAEY